jgi:hypothetical protein
MSRSAIHAAVGVATLVALVAATTAFGLSAVPPALADHAFTVATGMAVGAIALTAAVVTAAYFRLRLPRDNDAWIYW